MRRLVSLSVIAALAASSTGCTFAARKHRGMGVAADVSALAAVAVLAQREECPSADHTFVEDEFYDEVDANWSCHGRNGERDVAGGALLLTAGVLGLATLILEATEHDKAEPAPTAIPTVETGAPGASVRFDPPTIPPAADNVDPTTVRLGLQAWRTADEGYCDASRGLMAKIESRDHAYHAHLTLNGTIASCLR